MSFRPRWLTRPDGAGSNGLPWFRGSFAVRLDAKGRLMVPAPWRACMEEAVWAAQRAEMRSIEDLTDTPRRPVEVAIHPGEFEPCLVVRPMAAWLRIEEVLSQHPDMSLRPPGGSPHASAEARARAQWMCRRIIGQAVAAALDAKGRLLIPPCPAAAKARAGLSHEVRLIGVGEAFELWDEATWYERSDLAHAPARRPAA